MQSLWSSPFNKLKLRRFSVFNKKIISFMTNHLEYLI